MQTDNLSILPTSTTTSSLEKGSGNDTSTTLLALSSLSSPPPPAIDLSLLYPPFLQDPATKCRLQSQARLDAASKLDRKEWLANIPILSHIVTLDNIHNVNLIVQALGKSIAKRYIRGTWYCHYNNNNSTRRILAKAITNQVDPNSLLTIQCPANNTTMLSVMPLPTNSSTRDVSKFNNRYYYYNLTLPLACQEEEELQFQRTTMTRQEPQDPTPIYLAACTMIGGTNYTLRLREWIVYHRLLGVQHFWIYLHAPWETYYYNNATTKTNNVNTTTTKFQRPPLLLLAPDITYIPYYLPEFPKRVWQVAMNKECLFRAKKYKIDWLITTDVDELIWVAPPWYSKLSRQELRQQGQRGGLVFKKSSSSLSTTNNATADPKERWIRNYPLRHYLKERLSKSDYKVNSLVMKSIGFGNKQNKDATTPRKPPFLMMDNVYRYNTSVWERYKTIVRVQSPTMDLGVHSVHGPERRMLDDYHEISVRHYKHQQQQPDKVYWPKDKRFRRPKTEILDSSLPDMFRDIVLEKLAEWKE